MTIFDYLKDIIVTKSGNLPLEQYQPFLINRFLSFINPTVCEAMNQINNKVLMEDKDLHYRMVTTMFPKMDYVPKINYIKKVKEDLEENEQLKIKLIAERFEISQREALFLLGGV